MWDGAAEISAHRIAVERDDATGTYTGVYLAEQLIETLHSAGTRR